MAKTATKGQEILEMLKQDILNGKYVPGKEFPSIVQLMRRFDVSRVTAVRVTESLKKAGLVISRQGRGTFVTRRARLLGGAVGLIVPGICYSEVFPLICRNDHLAAHLLLTLRKLGKRVPEDVRVTGCNDSSYAAILEPSLTTVRMPCEDIAATAYRFLMERIADPSLPIRECYLKASLIARASTGKGGNR